MWKDFFYYTRSEQRVIVALLLVLAVLVGVQIGRRSVSQEGEMQAPDSAETVALRQLEAHKRGSSRQQENAGSRHRLEVPVRLHPFDPNTADSVTLRGLGLPPHVVRNLLKYRSKGGVFRSPEALSRIYGLTPSLYQTLQPYIQLPLSERPPSSGGRVKTTALSSAAVTDSVSGRTAPAEGRRVVKYPVGTVLDLNRCDTAELKKIPGIGSVRARKIVAYRERLGGYYDVAQLRDILPEELSLEQWFRVVPGEGLRPLSVNSDGLERLRRHPYMDFYKAKVIVEHRRRRGKLTSLAQLSLYEEFTEQDLERLAPYLSFD